MDAFVAPPALQPGSVVAVVAPASGFDCEELLRGLAWLSIRYRLRFDGRLFARTGFLAGPDDARADALSLAMRDDQVGAIVCARGGYGSMRIVDELPWDAFVARPKWLVGFSDVTALHVEAGRRGIASVHGPNVTGLGRSITPAERAALISSLEGRSPRGWRGGASDVVVPGEARGAIVGGNLTLLGAMAAAGRLRLPPGCVLALEDVTEAPYRVDRVLTSLLLGGHLRALSAIVLGDFTRCEPRPDRVTVDAVLAERVRALGIPVVRGAPFGHDTRNHAFPLGRPCALAADSERWTLQFS